MYTINQETQTIYSEFLTIQTLVSSFKPTMQETDRILQFEFSGLDSIDILYELKKLNFFDVHCGSDKIDFAIMQIEDRYSETDIRSYISKKIRIKYTKDTSKNYVEKLDYYFFNEDKALDFLINYRKTNTVDRVFVGVYNITPCSTPVYEFLDLKFNISGNLTRKIDDTFMTKLERVSKNSGKVVNPFSNVLSFTLNGDCGCSPFHQKIKGLFYTCFFDVISYKNNKNEFDIRGKKSITVFKDENFSVDNYETFVDLIDFLYKDDKFLEKFLIIKNVVTRYIHDNASFSEIDAKIIEIFKTSNHYFEQYIQNDLDDFFKNRDSIYKEAINTSKSINEQNDKINTYINASLVSFLILVMTFIFNNFESFNLKNLIFAALAFMIFSISFFTFIYKSSLERYQTIKDQFNLFLDKMGIILSTEKEEITESYLVKPYNDLEKSLNRIELVCNVINISLVILIAAKVLYVLL